MDGRILNCDATLEVGADILQSVTKSEKWLFLGSGNKRTLINKDNILYVEYEDEEDEKKADIDWRGI